MSLRKVASVLVGLGLVIGLMGAGIGASFTDSATATTNIKVGTFAVNIVAPVTTGAVIAGDAKSVTYDCGTILSSVASSCPFSFTVKDVGTIGANSVTVTAVVAGDGTTFTDILGPVTPFALAAGATHTFNGGLQWSALGMGNLGQSVSVTYTVTATN